MSTQLPPAPRRVSHSASELAFLHFIIHWFAGMAIMAVVVTVTVLTDATSKTSPQGFVIFGGFALGIPAGVVGLLRVPLMIWLFRRASAWPATQPGRLLRLLSGAALVFLVPITVPLLLYKVKMGQSLLHAATYTSGTMYVYFGASLPWLVGAVGAAWWLTRRLWPTPAGFIAPSPSPSLNPDREQPDSFPQPVQPQPAD